MINYCCLSWDNLWSCHDRWPTHQLLVNNLLLLVYRSIEQNTEIVFDTIKDKVFNKLLGILEIK